MDFLAWYNILFLSALAVSLCVVIGAALGAVHIGDVDVDGHADADVDADATVDGAGKALFDLLGLLDLGQVPFTILLMTASLIFGLSGVAVSLVFTSVFSPDSPWLGPLALLVALVVMVVLTARLARFIIRHVPASETYVSTTGDLVGCTGEMFTRSFADVKTTADVHRIACRSDSELAPGMKIVVVDYDPDTKLYGVAPIEP